MIHIRPRLGLAAPLLLLAAAFAPPAAAQTWSSWWGSYHNEMLWGDHAWSQRRLQELPEIVDRELVDREVVPLLIELLGKERDPRLRANLAWALGRVAGPDSRADACAALLEALHDSEDSVRASAVGGLGYAYMSAHGDGLLEMGRDSADGRRMVDNKALLESLRAGAVTAMGLSHDPKYADALIELFDDVPDGEHGIRSSVLRALGRCGAGSDAALEFLQDRVKDHWLEETVRSSAARALAELGRAEALPVLDKLLDKSNLDEQIAASAVLAIGELGDASDSKVVKLLVDEAFKNDDASVRTRALMGVTLLLCRDLEANANSKQHKTYVTKLKAQLKKPKFRTDGPLHALAAGVYSRVHRESGEPLMKLVVKELDDVKDPGARGAYALALGLAPDEESGELLLELFRDIKHPTVRTYVAEALGLLRADAASPDLVSEIGQRGQVGGLIRNAVLATMLFDDPDGVSRVAALLADTDNVETRGDLLGSLSAFRTPDAVHVLRDVLADDKHDEATRRAACVALGYAADSRVTPPWTPY